MVLKKSAIMPSLLSIISASCAGQSSAEIASETVHCGLVYISDEIRIRLSYFIRDGDPVWVIQLCERVNGVCRPAFSYDNSTPPIVSVHSANDVRVSMLEGSIVEDNLLEIRRLFPRVSITYAIEGNDKKFSQNSGIVIGDTPRNQCSQFGKRYSIHQLSQLYN
jgi:hypothetical protein